jgi:hypothetical protein
MNDAGEPPPDPGDPINVEVEALRRQLLSEERANEELRRMRRALGEGAWRSPMTWGVLLVLFVLTAIGAKAYYRMKHGTGAYTPQGGR